MPVINGQIEATRILIDAYVAADVSARIVIEHAHAYLFWGQQVYAMSFRGKAEPSSVDGLIEAGVAA